jgi:hypothetical protein
VSYNKYNSGYKIKEFVKCKMTNAYKLVIAKPEEKRYFPRPLQVVEMMILKLHLMTWSSEV